MLRSAVANDDNVYQIAVQQIMKEIVPDDECAASGDLKTVRFAAGMGEALECSLP
ncbi:hypothetical protein ABID16_003445 [Rhizobium aquaticum]|uniref:Uncharacterized protein n=1 Tax=Rhizobium aquaticum TaxID=1549636 RepID=A0ABV2J2X1_9HYPH